MREAPYFVLNTLSRQTAKVLSRPGMSDLVCKALKVINIKSRQTFIKKNGLHF